MYIPLLVQMFSIFKKLKNVKRVCPKKIIKGQKQQKRSKKIKSMNPKKRKGHESEQVKMPLLVTLL